MIASIMALRRVSVMSALHMRSATHQIRYLHGRPIPAPRCGHAARCEGFRDAAQRGDAARLYLFDDGQRVGGEAISVRPESGTTQDAGFIELRAAELLAAPSASTVPAPVGC
jgi:hypothetical protein